jgi:integrase
MTFRELAELRLETDNAISASTKTQYRQAFDADVFGAIGHIPAREVTADAIARVLDVVESRGASVHADRVRSAIGSTFKWAVKRRQAGVLTDPTAGLGKRSPALPRTRLITDAELVSLWHGIDASGSPLTKRMQLIVKLTILTGQRRSEVCGATISELNLDNSSPTWTIPGDKRRAGNIVPGRMKNRLDQIVPLSRQAAERWREAVNLLEHSD